MSEWGPWIEHDGKGCPCRGEYVHIVYEDQIEFCGIAGSGEYGGKSWDWSNAGLFSRVIRYRIRKPRGLTILESVLREVEREDA